MPRYNGDPDFKHGSPQKVGVLVSNLGSPDESNTAAVRRYLAEFLMDPRVVEVPRFLWRVILYGWILRTRPRRSAHAYQQVWSDAGSPLIDISRQQKRGIADRLKQRFGANIEVELAMRYGNPSIADALERLNSKNVRKLFILPLYPQYSAVTGASTFDAVASVLMKKRWIPELRTINQYHDHPGYIDALAASVESFWASHGRGERLLMSFHGVPKSYLLEGDPYHCQCHKTARLLAERLNLADDQWSISFQSRLGRTEWLRPYTDDVIRDWAGEGLKNIDCICPGFSADCLETLEEMVMQYGELFVEHGGQALNYVPCLNAGDQHLDFLAALAGEHLHPWIAEVNAQNEGDLTGSRERATALGAPH